MKNVIKDMNSITLIFCTSHTTIMGNSLNIRTNFNNNIWSSTFQIISKQVLQIMQTRPSLARSGMFKGFFISCCVMILLFEVCDWMNCVLFGILLHCISIANVRRSCRFCYQMFLFHLAFLWIHFWHVHQGCVYPMRPEIRKSMTHLLVHKH